MTEVMVLNSYLFDDKSLLKLISREWPVSTHQKVLAPLKKRKKETFQVHSLDKIKECF